MAIMPWNKILKCMKKIWLIEKIDQHYNRKILKWKITQMSNRKSRKYVWYQVNKLKSILWYVTLAVQLKKKKNKESPKFKSRRKVNRLLSGHQTSESFSLQKTATWPLQQSYVKRKQGRRLLCCCSQTGWLLVCFLRMCLSSENGRVLYLEHE